MKNLRAILLIGINYVRIQGITVLIMVVYLTGMAVVFFHNQRSQEARFFLQLHSFYVVFIAMMIAVPAVYGERKSRRIVAVLSKGIHRWEYLGGILCGCGLVSAIFCVLVGGISWMLSLRGGYSTAGLGSLLLVLFACALMASSIGLFFGTFLHPLLATAAASATIALPLIVIQAGLKPASGLFPASWLAKTVVNFQFGMAADVGEVVAVVAMALCLTIVFWLAASVVFARRDVTISME